MKIQATDWGWRHSGRHAWALQGVDFGIEPGERVLILGPSGAGKSTLLKALAGVLGDSEEGEEQGSLTIGGQLARTLRGQIGLMLQDPQANTILGQLGDDVVFGCENMQLTPDQMWPRAAAALEAVGLDLPLDHSTDALSGGQRQRLALAGILAMSPQILLLDEPTANLDPEGVLEVRDAVAGVLEHTRATLVVVEHRVDVWLPLVDRVIVLEPHGGVRADGPAEEILRRHGEELAAEGIWVPHLPVQVERQRSQAGELLLSAQELFVGRKNKPVGSSHNLDFHAGESMVVTGVNGAGKSTLALTMAGLLPPVGGEVVASELLCSGLKKRDPYRWKSKELVRRIGTVFQLPEQQFLTGTVRAELAIGPRACGMDKAASEQIVERLLAALNLNKVAEANPFTLSGGEQRRLSVATALATRPRILFLDEPTFGQDRNTWTELVHLITELVDDGVSVVSISHDKDLVRILGDRVVSIGPNNEGK